MKTPIAFAFVTLVLVNACSAQTSGTSQRGQRVQSYEECVAEGYPVLKTFPPRCQTPDGQVFIRETRSQLCVDKCGDTQCQQIVCMGEGCPCAESKESCPKDCK